MSQPLSTQQFVEGVDLRGDSAHVEVDVRDDGRIALISSTPRNEPLILGADQAACLRNQLGGALTAALRDARTTRGVDAS
ncbi:hypothetical protein [Amycolatopsis sp. NPDC051371]|uniref:hypothetical protein n=1 Tax=Amycolatopsis sp. NPDC051371 TaxID=3155800 RepID=UPI003417D91C